MKTYVYIFILFLSLLVYSGCNTNRNMSATHTTATDQQSKAEKETSASYDHSSTSSAKDSIQTSDQSASVATSDDEKTSTENEYEEQNKRKVEFYPDGAIKSIEDSNYRKGRTNDTNERGRSSHVSTQSGGAVGHSTMETTEEVKIDKRTEEKKEVNKKDVSNEETSLNEKSDSRWIQGWEWLGITVPIAVIIAITYLIRNGRKKKHSEQS